MKTKDGLVIGPYRVRKAPPQHPGYYTIPQAYDKTLYSSKKSADKQARALNNAYYRGYVDGADSEQA